jgi:hypothetical protein
MKIKELKSKKVVNELQLSSFGLGDYGSALGKQLVGKGGGLTKQDLMTQNIYIKNFVSNALSNLNNAVKGGLVDPKKVEPRAAVAGDFDKVPNPFGDWDTENKLKQQKAQQAQAAKDKAAADAAQAKINKAASAPTSPATSAAVDARLARAQQQTPPTSVSDKLDKAAAQRGKAPYVQTKQNTPTNQPPMPRVRESSYEKLNALFETILETVLPQETNTQSIKDYLKTVWLPNYLKGVNWKPNEQQIDKILQQVQDTYAKDGGRGALNQLASLSYSITPRSIPKDNKKNKSDQKSDEKSATKTTAQPAAAQPAAQQPVAQKRTGGKVKGALSNDPRAVARRQATAAKRATDAGLTVSKPQASQAAPAAPITATWGGVKYTKTAKGWVDNKRRPADANTIKFLDQAVSQSNKDQPTPPNKPKGPAAPTAGPGAGAAQQADDEKVIKFKKTA